MTTAEINRLNIHHGMITDHYCRRNTLISLRHKYLVERGEGRKNDYIKPKPDLVMLCCLISLSFQFDIMYGTFSSIFHLHSTIFVRDL